MHRTLIGATALAMLAVAACSGRQDSDSERGPCSGSAGGTMSLTERTEMLFALDFRDDSTGNHIAHIEAVVVGRGAPGWKTKGLRPSSIPANAARDSAANASSGSIGSFDVKYDRDTHTAWIGSMPVALDSFNVLLVDSVDRMGGAPVIGQRFRIAPDFRVTQSICAGRPGPDQLGHADTLRARLLRSPAVRAFAAPAAPR
jgi:hypothetical protein